MKNMLMAFFLALAFLILDDLIISINGHYADKKNRKIQRDLNRARAVYCNPDADKTAKKVAYTYIKKTLPLLPKNWICNYEPDR